MREKRRLFEEGCASSLKCDAYVVALNNIDEGDAVNTANVDC